MFLQSAKFYSSLTFKYNLYSIYTVSVSFLIFFLLRLIIIVTEVTIVPNINYYLQMYSIPFWFM